MAWLKPRPDHAYRVPATLRLVPPEGAELDPLDLDIARALACGDLVEGEAPAPDPAPGPAPDPAPDAVKAPKAKASADAQSPAVQDEGAAS